MSDEEFNELVRALGMSNRRAVVKALLAGNDTQCFTDQQYAEAYHSICHRGDLAHRDGWIKWLTKLAPQHLLSVGMRQVSPGVWAKEDTDG